MQHRAIRRYNYHKWANERTFDHLKSLPDEIYDHQITNVFPSIRETIAHIYQVDGMWLSVMSGDTFDQTKRVIGELLTKMGDKSLFHMQDLYNELTGEFDSFLKSRENLDAMIDIEHPQYGKRNLAISDLVEHVVNHGTYHRGNITSMIRQQSHSGVPTDYIFYLYENL